MFEEKGSVLKPVLFLVNDTLFWYNLSVKRLEVLIMSTQGNFDDDYDLQIKRSMKPGNEKLARKREAEHRKKEKEREKIRKRKKSAKAALGVSIFTFVLFGLMILAGVYFIFFKDLSISFGNNTTPVTDEEGNTVATEAEKKDDISKKFTDFFGGGKKASGKTEYVEYTPTEVNSDMYSDPGKYALTTDYDYVTAEDDYYNDALFIGDSRIEGFRLHNAFPGATYYSKTGIGISTIMWEQIAMAPNGVLTSIPDALQYTQFKKIYIMVGVNNMAAHNTEQFLQVYSDMISTIREKQPDAKIFILSIMHVSARYNDGGSGLTNNININDRNVAISTLADGKDIFYINLNQLICEDNFDIKAGYSGDGLHLKDEYYDLWVDYLNKHALPEYAFE